jgi:1,4-dihydroxy-2-naphthoate octaprenyltransferase
MFMMKASAWLSAFRLRTLPLAFSSVILGSLLALSSGSFYIEILIASLLTTLFLQVLSNLANDYGDHSSGVDNDKRVGPQRAVQSGEITPKEMLVGIAICALLALGSGIWLLLEAISSVGLKSVLIFFGIGLLAITAAITYTVGKRPYGYIGLGDVMVFIFFGIVGVGGTFYLHTNEMELLDLLPAVSIGLLATGVLNLNNMRDEHGDREAGKRSLVVLMGLKRARIYHAFLIITAMVSALAYTALRYNSPYQFLFLISFPVLIQNIFAVFHTEPQSELDKELKKLALSTLVFSLTFGIGMIY